MGINHQGALGVAVAVYGMQRSGTVYTRSEKEGLVLDLMQYNVFEISEIAKILDMTPDAVKKAAGLENDHRIERRRRWALNSIDSLYVIAVNYDTFGFLSPGHKDMLLTVLQNGTSIGAVAALTGVPHGELRKVVYGEDGLGILRARTQPASG